MPLGLLKYGFSSKYPAKHHFTPAKDLKKHYDVVIIGGGGHGCAIAYNLAKYHGITNVAILEKSYLGGGNTARNTFCTAPVHSPFRYLKPTKNHTKFEFDILAIIKI